MCHLNPILLISFQEELSIQHFEHPHYGGRDPNGYHRSHQTGLQQVSTLPQTTWNSERYKLHSYKINKTLHRSFPSWTNSSESLHTADSTTTADIPRPTGKPVHTRSWRGSDLLCENGTTNFLCTRNWRIDGIRRGCSHHFSQDTTSIYWLDRSSQRGRTITAIYTSLSNKASDAFAFKSLRKTGCLSRTHRTSSCWATTTKSITTWETLDTKDKELGKDSHSSVPNLLKVQETSNTTAHGELPTRVQPSRPFNWHRLSWTHLPTIGNNTQQDNNKGLHCYFCLFCDKGCTLWGCHKLTYRSISCCPRTFHSTSKQTKNNLLRQTVPTSNVHPTNFMTSTTCFNLPH